MSGVLQPQLSSSEAELLRAYQNMMDKDRTFLVSFAKLRARNNPRVKAPHLTLVVNSSPTGKVA